MVNVFCRFLITIWTKRWSSCLLPEQQGWRIRMPLIQRLLTCLLIQKRQRKKYIAFKLFFSFSFFSIVGYSKWGMSFCYRHAQTSQKCISCLSIQWINALQSHTLILMATGIGPAKELLNRYPNHTETVTVIL